MNRSSSRRSFLAAGLALPAVASASRFTAQAQQAPANAPSTGLILKYKTLGKTGMKVTTVGFGTMITSDGSVIARAADMGINYFDTSRGYSNGQNERMVGAALNGKRNNLFISTKCDRNTKTDVLAELDTSLKELNTDHVDVWHLHGKQSPQQISDDLVDAQLTAKKQGKIRFMGVSCHANLPGIVDRLIEAKMDVVQPQFSYMQDPTWAAAIDKLNQAGIAVVAMKVMARAGGRGRGAAPQPARPANLAPAALKWVIKNPAIGTTVPSMTDMDQLDQNFKVMAEDFTAEDQKVLTASIDHVGPYYCRTCGECAGQCPKGLFASEMVRFVMYADGYGQFALGRENFQRMPLELQQIRCGDCDRCVVQCPHGINIAERLSRAQELFA